jgi:hypothetical protein
LLKIYVKKILESHHPHYHVAAKEQPLLPHRAEDVEEGDEDGQEEHRRQTQ